MKATLRAVDADRLERSCSPRDFIRFGPRADGLERAEAFLTTCAFEPHRHDTYAIGITTIGVQTFRYRGRRRVCLPGQLHVLHPDETHDGAPATDDGFGYRILYVAPELVREALDDGALPFVAEPVQERTPVTQRLASLLLETDEQIDELGRVEIVAAAADVLRALGDRRVGNPLVDVAAVERVREYLAVHACEQTTAVTLERIAGLDRFTIARHFRRAFGTSPDRYRTLRRLAVARAAIERGVPLVQAAAEAGFADQSHMTRQFKRTYGLTPARWAAAVTDGSRTPARPPRR
ncbi:MAG TPA: AraC family transcriptional regulator [Gaiellaceae bacterium]|jgi:AraC-like DNA-binding protein